MWILNDIQPSYFYTDDVSINSSENSVHFQRQRGVTHQETVMFKLDLM